MDNKNKPSEKLTQSIKIFMLVNTANDEIVKEKLQNIYKHTRVFESSIAQNGTRLLSFEVYGNLSSRVSSVALHELFKAIIKLEGTAQFISTDGTFFVLDSLSSTTELSSSTFKASDYTATTKTK